jgi:hypothetical protein
MFRGYMWFQDAASCYVFTLIGIIVLPVIYCLLIVGLAYLSTR